MQSEYKLMLVTVKLSNGKKAKYMITAKDKEAAEREVEQKAKQKHLYVTQSHCKVIGQTNNYRRNEG